MVYPNHTLFPTDFMTVSETAKYMGIGRKLVYQLIEFGELDAYRQEGALWIDKACVDAFVKCGKMI